MSELQESIKKIKELAAVPVKDDRELKRVEIIMLKFKEPPEIIDRAVSRIIHNTDWPFKLTIFDNRPNTANTSRIWNKLVQEATCPYILIMDSDAFIPPIKTLPCWLTRMMGSIDDTGIVIPVSSAPGGAHQHVSGPKDFPAWVPNKDVWSGYFFLFSKEAYEKVGPFEEKFYIYGQDSEWAHRSARKVGGAIMREDVFVEHIGGASFKSNPDRDADKLYARELFKYMTQNT